MKKNAKIFASSKLVRIFVLSKLLINTKTYIMVTLNVNDLQLIPSENFEFYIANYFDEKAGHAVYVGNIRKEGGEWLTGGNKFKTLIEAVEALWAAYQATA